jgi:hypothetical protein
MGAAAAPMLIGSAIGAFTNKDPLKGALLGGFMGAAGGALMPTLGGLGSTAATAGTTAAGANIPAGAAFINPAGVNAATAAATGPSAILGVEAAKSAGSGIFSAPRAVNTAITPSFERPLTLGMPNVEPGQGYQYTLGDRFSQIGQFAQQNPVLTQMASQTGQSLLQQQERPLSTPGLLRGSQIPMEAAQYDVGIPKVSLI